jgi:hypothetical protein
MNMLLLVGISVGFALSLLTSNNFYAERSFTSSVNQVACNEMKSESCQKLIARVSNSQGVRAEGLLSSYGSQSLGRQRFLGRFLDRISNFFGRFS